MRIPLPMPWHLYTVHFAPQAQRPKAQPNPNGSNPDGSNPNDPNPNLVLVRSSANSHGQDPIVSPRAPFLVVLNV